MTRQLHRDPSLFWCLPLLLAPLLGCVACSEGADSTESPTPALATKIESRKQLIGGDGALGKVGDYLLKNGKIRVVVQDTGYNRGSGLFGGSLIDADLVRTRNEGGPFGTNGSDTFGELFPAFFLEAIDPEEVEIVNDGSDGEAAVVAVRGKGGEFVTMLRYLNQVMVNSYESRPLGDLVSDALNDELAPPMPGGTPKVSFETRYILEPGAEYVRIESTIRNESFETLGFPNQTVLDTLENFLGVDLGDFTVPTGHVLGFGAANDIFVPGIGYDLRWGLEEAYQSGADLPAFPGKLADFVAASNPEGISYGFFTGNSPDSNFVCQKDCCRVPREARDCCRLPESERAQCYEEAGYSGRPADVADVPDAADTASGGDASDAGDSDASGTDAGFDADGGGATSPYPELLYGGDADANDLLMLFYASGFGGVFSDELPSRLAPSFCDPSRPDQAEAVCDEQYPNCDGEACEEERQQCVDLYDACIEARKGLDASYTFTNYFTVGNGTVSSVLDSVYEVRGVDATTVAGRVHDRQTGSPVGKDVEVIVSTPRPEADDPESGCSYAGEGEQRRRPEPYSQTFTNSEGYFDIELPPGDYCYRAHEKGRPLPDEFHHFRVGSSEKFLRIGAGSRAFVRARITDDSGHPLPSKVTVVGTHEFRGDLAKRFYLYDLESGEPWRTADMEPDRADEPETRRYVQAVDYASSDGRVRMTVPPGEYTLYFSRGPEYELVEKEVDLGPGGVARANVALDKVVDTSGWVSGDFHMHAQGSIDTGLNYRDRVVSIAAEDVEVVVSSDHNYVSDFQPYIEREGLEQWMRSVVGVELTTFEFGHFNAFPLDYDVGSINRGSPKWQRTPPQDIFDELRSRGSLGPDRTIVQVNHPRDSILGYFRQFNVDGFTAQAELPIDEAEGAEAKVTEALTMPNGDAFVRDCRPEDVDCTPDCPDGETCQGPDFETTFSWDFDALEIFNGKEMEFNRHFRVPYGDGENSTAWPDEVVRRTARQICDRDNFCSDPAELVEDRCCENDYESPTDEACETGEGDRGACPVLEMQRKEVASRYPEDAVLCQEGEVAYPGGLDDWYNMLNYTRPFVENRPGATTTDDEKYNKITATGNSDSHHAGSPQLREPGHPRNYFYVGHDDPVNVTNEQFVKALQNHRNIVTNGPFVQLHVLDGDVEAGVGQQVQVGSGDIELRVTVRAAEWVGADRFRVMANGEPLDLGASNDVDPDDNGWVGIDLGEDGEFQNTYDVDVDRDTWFVLEVEGDNNLFPVYPPTEIPRLPFDEVIGQIAGSFGFGGDIEGLSPDETFALRPFAFTNPIWTVHESTEDGFTPPEPEPPSCEGPVAQPGGLVRGDVSRPDGGEETSDGHDHPHGGDHSHPHGDHGDHGDSEDDSHIEPRLRAVPGPPGTGREDESPLPPPKGEFRDIRTLFRGWGSGGMDH